MEPVICPFCHTPISQEFSFCPYCGKSLKPVVLSFGKQIGVYALSLFLPPLGLIPGIKYALQQDAITRRTGIVAIILTVLSIIITLWLTMVLLNQLNTNISGQLQQYQNLGY